MCNTKIFKCNNVVYIRKLCELIEDLLSNVQAEFALCSCLYVAIYALHQFIDCLNPLLPYFRIQKFVSILNRKSRNKLKARVSTCGISIVVHVSLTFTTGRSLLLLLSALPRCYCCTNTTTKSFNAIALKLCPFSNKSFRFVSILVSCVRVFFHVFFVVVKQFVALFCLRQTASISFV